MNLLYIFEDLKRIPIFPQKIQSKNLTILGVLCMLYGQLTYRFCTKNGDAFAPQNCTRGTG